MARRKLNQFEVDQSVRIEELNRDTVIGVANTERGFAYILPRKVKRHFNENFRRIGKPRQCAPTLFAISMAHVLMKRELRPGSLIIDAEYARHEEFIVSILEHYFPRTVVSIERIGKNSPAHKAAYFTHVGKRKADGVISRRDIYKVFGIKKTAGELHHLEFTRIHKSTQPVKKKYTRKR